MTNIDLSILDQIYSKYEYELKRSSKEVRVYVFKKNMYFGADIIPIKEDVHIDPIKKEFSDAGYAVIVRNYKDLEDVENTLFDGFFNTEINIQRNKKKYLQFVQKQNRFLGQEINYQYITSPFTSNLPNCNNVVQTVSEIIQKKGAYLVIIEAAAGFGKTCTAFEILNDISTKITTKCPFFAELSRNRENRTFKQVLLTEMDAEFPSMVKSDLVKHHIFSGRIPLIIDGFDELLSKEKWKENNETTKFGNVETMLTTIGDLLIENSKVILTSRKTAIFSGDEFQRWLENYDTKFDVVRFSLEEPRIKDWLDDEKVEILKGKNVPIKQVSNPVLLAYLRNIQIDEFNKLIMSTDSILDRYFTSILEREQVRQNLFADPNIQLHIFKKLARLFTEYNITAESKEFIKELIVDYNPNRLPEIRKNYPPPKPTIDELAEILCNHALLDRRDLNDNVGFINDFIFGTLIGICICEQSFRLLPESFSQHILELAVTAFKYYSDEKRICLWKILNSKEYKTDNQFKLLLDISLNDYISKGFAEETFQDYVVEEVSFDDRSSFIMCVFINCVFKNCIFDIAIFDKTSFVDCTFYHCKLITSEKEAIESIFTLGCEDYDSGFLSTIKTISNHVETSNEVNLTKELLSKFFKVDGKSSRPRQLSQIIKEFNDIDIAQLLSEIEKLRRKNILIMDGNLGSLTPEGIVYYHGLLR